MTVRECYEKMGSNYDNVLVRLNNDNMIKRFALKFINDTSYEKLAGALKADNCQEAFRAAHTLKGVCINLGFDKLYEVSSELTEKLRAEDMDGVDELFGKVTELYNFTIATVKELEN